MACRPSARCLSSITMECWRTVAWMWRTLQSPSCIVRQNCRSRQVKKKVMAYVGMAYVVMACVGMACVVMACLVMAYVVMAYVVMACIEMAYI